METAGDEWGRLMRAALAGDDVSYRQLLDELARTFRAFVRARLARSGAGNADLEDIVQDALLAVHLKRDTWDPARAFAPWAQAVVAHKLSDRLRRSRLRVHDPIDDAFDLAAPAEPDATASADVERMLADLPPPQRRIVAAISVEGRSAQEVAREIGSSEGAVRVALHRALKRLAILYGGSRS